MDPSLGDVGQPLALEPLVHPVVIGEHEGLDETDARAATQQFITQIRGLAIDGQHQRRPVTVAVGRAVDAGAVRQEQVNNVASLALNGDVQRLRPAAPERVRSDGVHEGGRRLQHRPDVVNPAGSDAL